MIAFSQLVLASGGIAITHGDFLGYPIFLAIKRRFSWLSHCDFLGYHTAICLAITRRFSLLSHGDFLGYHTAIFLAIKIQMKKCYVFSYFSSIHYCMHLIHA